ncbi:MAG TPA: archease [Thermoprotei archaeon]|nr:archease [Thermoprotei archaeon]
MNKVYETLPHTADIKLMVEGETLEEIFEKAAYALIDTAVDIETVEPKEKIRVVVRGTDIYELLYNFIEELIVLIDAESKVFSKFKVTINKKDGAFMLEGELWGEHLDLKKHKPKIHVKAATYHEMEIKKEDSKYILSFVLDI